MCRLAALLRRFELPPGAGAAELKRAYLREAKRLHPDRNPAERGRAERDFQRLREAFEEAQRLLAARAPGARAGAGAAPGAGARASRAPRRAGWSAAAWAAAAPPPGARGAVPVVGLPPEAVYSGVLTISATFLLFQWLWADRWEEPAADRAVNYQVSSDINSWVGGPISRLRDALEGKSAVKGARARTEVQVEDHVHTGEFVTGLAHAAASNGHIWWLERCGASSECRPQLDLSDASGDTPLHHCARSGQDQACRTLLRLGADPTRRNLWSLTPEQLALHSKHHETAALIRGACHVKADGASAAAPRPVWRHPDGLGVFAERSDFAGTQPTESLRHAANLALGRGVVGRRALAAAPARGQRPARGPGGPGEPGDAEDAARAAERLGALLRAEGYDLEAAPAPAPAAAPGGAGPPARLWAPRGDGAQVCGLLVHEPPGRVTADAPGHWAALRLCPRAAGAGAAGAADAAGAPGRGGAAVGAEGGEGGEAFLRLDPVRGPFRLSPAEAAELLARYRAWRLLLRPPGPPEPGRQAAAEAPAAA